MIEDCNKMEDKRSDCNHEFIRIWERLGKGDVVFDRLREVDHTQELNIKELQVNMISLIKSMGSLTRAIWGAVLAMAAAGAGFIIWYVQNI